MTESPAAPSLEPRTWAEIDLTALRHNAAAIRERIGAGPRLLAVVKANAYGHGVGPVVRALAGSADLFGVANVAEALEIRSHLPAAQVFILGPALPHERAEIVRAGFIPSVSDADEARAYAACATHGPVSIHLVLDTGMGRIGIWQDEARETVRAIAAIPGVKIAGFASHLPVADEDDAFTREQLARFHTLVAQLRSDGIDATAHIDNSAGALGYAPPAGDLVRPGIALYGHSPLAEWQRVLRPVLAWKTRIALIREVGPGRSVSYGRTYFTPQGTRIGTLPVGYADGFQRHLSGKNAHVLIGGRRCPVLGRVTMDQILVDLAPVPEARVGDEAVLLGRQGGEEIPVGELAEKAGTIPWEIFTGLGRRVVRRYIGL